MTGSGTLRLTGGDDSTPSSLYTLRAESGTVVLDGARIDLTSTDFSLTTGALLAYSGDITIQNGADVRMATDSFGFVGSSGAGSSLTVTGSSLTGDRLHAAKTSGDTGSILVEDSASLDLEGALIIGYLGDGDLTVQTGASTSADKVSLGVVGTAWGEARVTGNNSLLSSNNLHFGGQDTVHLGGTGTLTVDGGGAAEVAGQTKFWTSTSSMTIDGGTFETDQLNNHTAVTVTVSISDPAGGTALTVGTADGSSTFDGLIEDAAGGPGSLAKAGSGTFTLTGANTFSGTTDIDDGSIIVGHANTLQNSTVSINVNDGLDMTTNIIDATIGALAGSGDLDLGSQSLSAGGNDASTTYSGALSGAGPLSKTGAGTLTLTGNNSYTGETHVLAGTLIATGMDERIPQSAPVKVSPGATLEVDGIIETIEGLKNSAGSVVLTNGATLRLDPTNLRVFPGAITGAADTTIEKLGTFTHRLDAANPDFFGTTMITGGTIRLNHADALQNSTVAIQVDDGLDVTTHTIDATIGALAGGGNLDLGSTRLATGGNGATTYSGIISGDASSGLSHGSADMLTLTGTGSNFGLLKADSSGTVILDGFGATLTKDTGTAALRAAGGALTVSNGSTIITTSRDVVASTGIVTVVGSGTQVTSGRRILVTFGGEFIVEDLADVTANNALIAASQVGAGSGTLTVRSGGSVGISGSTTVGEDPGDVGDLVVTGTGSSFSTGNLELGGSDSSQLGGTANVPVDDGGSLTVDGTTTFFTSASNMTIDGGAFSTGELANHTSVVPSIAISDPASGSALTVGTNDSSSIFDGLITAAAGGAGSLEKAGSGTFTLTGANTFSGTTDIDSGSIIVGHASALQNSTVSVNIDDGLDVTTNTIDATIGALAGGGNLSLGSQELVTGGNGADTTYSGVISGTSDSILRHNGAGTLTLTGGDEATPSSVGTLRAQSGPVVVDDARIDLTSTDFSVDTGALLAKNGDITIRSGADVRMATGNYGMVENSALAVIGIGSSLTGTRLDAAAYSGNTGSILVEDSASLDLTGDLNIAFAGDGHLTVQTGASTSADKVVLGTTGVASGVARVTGNNSLLSLNELHFGGQDTTYLGGRGTLTVDIAGAVQVAGETKFWTSTSSMTIDGGTFETDRLIDHTAVTAAVSISDGAGGTALTVGTGNGSSTFDGLIEDATGGPGSFAKVGSGTFTPTGANTYLGGTTISGGTLLANNTTGSATGMGTVTVQSGGTLGGTGIIAFAVTANSGGTVAPGASAGTLIVDDVTLEFESTLAIELGGLLAGSEYDVLMVGAGSNLAGTLSLAYTNGFTAQPGDSFVILTAASLVGEFIPVVFPDGQNWTIEYDTLSGTVTVGICTDFDGDGVCDADDLCEGFDDNLDADSDGIPDGCDPCAGGAASGDTNADGSVDLEDYADFYACVAGPGGGLGTGCECFDFDDDDNDLKDLAAFQEAFTGG